jgi:nitrite reductase/ring-hydroxylating ferredoxin subunit
MKEPVLCALDALPEPGSKAFAIAGERGPEEIFLVRKDGQVHAYRNQCPHTGGPLDWVPDQFLDLDKRHIQCATHDARFRIEDGLCIKGPCAGQSLQPVGVRVAAGRVCLLGPQKR